MQTIRKYQPAILVEVLDEDIAQKLDHLLQGQPYLYFAIDEEKGLRKVERMQRSNCFNYLVCTNSIAEKIGLKIS